MTNKFIAAYKSLKDTKCLNITETFTILSCQNGWKDFYSDMITLIIVHTLQLASIISVRIRICVSIDITSVSCSTVQRKRHEIHTIVGMILILKWHSHILPCKVILKISNILNIIWKICCCILPINCFSLQEGWRNSNWINSIFKA